MIPALLALALAAADSTPKFVAPRTIAELEARITHVLDSAKVPGVGLAIVRHDSVIYTGGLGKARVSPEVRATDATLFRIGSTSKAFVALTALALEREGKLSLQDPLAKRLPGFYFKNAWESTDPIRIVHLLEHTSGFDDNSLQSYANSDPTPITLVAGLALDSATRVSRWRPGTHFSYCNTGPAIVARIIELIEGKPFEQVVQERWFSPIGMATATYMRPDSTRFPVATLYNADGVTAVPYWHVFIRPAGSINATSHDMAAYVRFLLGRGTANGHALLPAESLERLERSEASAGARAGLTLGYGLHMYRTTDSTGYTWTSHNGGVEGGLSDLSYMPAYGVGYAFQINSGNGAAFGMIMKLVRAYVTQGLTPPPAPARGAIAASVRGRYAGWYHSVSPRQQHLYFLERISSLAHVTFTDSTMRVKPVFEDAVMFTPVDSLRFRAHGEGAATLAFVADEANDRPEGIEAFGSRLGASLERVSGAQAVLSLVLSALWLAGIVLSLVAMLFGGIRWIVRRLRKTPSSRAAAATPWRWAGLAAGVLAADVVLVIASGGELNMLGRLTLFSGGMWAMGLLFGALALVGAGVAFGGGPSTSRWERISLSSARVVLALNLVAAAYLAYWGLIGGRTWA